MILKKISIYRVWVFFQRKKYIFFASHIRVAEKVLESHYRPKKDITVIMTKPQDIYDRDEDDDCDRRPVKEKISGMVVPALETKQGIVEVKY